MQKVNPVPWVLLVLSLGYAAFLSYPKKFTPDGREIEPTYETPKPLVEQKHDPGIIEPTQGLKLYKFWDEGDWRYVQLISQNEKSGSLIQHIMSTISKVATE